MQLRPIPSLGALVAAAAVSLLGSSSGPVGAATEFAMAGEVGGLYPGIETTMPVTVTNPESFPIELISVATQADDSGPACPGSLLSFGDLGPAVSIAAGATATLPITVRLDRATPDACQGATWLLVFSGTAQSTGSGSGSLAVTGANSVIFAVVACSLVVVGGVLRRQRQPAALRDDRC